MPADRYDIAVVGAGIVGLAVAREILARYGELRLGPRSSQKAIGQKAALHAPSVEQLQRSMQPPCECHDSLLFIPLSRGISRRCAHQLHEPRQGDSALERR